jgi:flavorubredoxin
MADETELINKAHLLVEHIEPDAKPLLAALLIAEAIRIAGNKIAKAINDKR